MAKIGLVHVTQKIKSGETSIRKIKPHYKQERVSWSDAQELLLAPKNCIKQTLNAPVLIYPRSSAKSHSL